MSNRSDFVSAARTCIGTPFRHRGRKPGIGLDCLGLLIYSGLQSGHVQPGFDIQGYRKIPDGNAMLVLCRQYMVEKNFANAVAGDVILMSVEQDPQHLGILADWQHGGLSMIHSCNLAAYGKQVVETRLVFHDRQKFVACFSLKEQIP